MWNNIQVLFCPGFFLCSFFFPFLILRIFYLSRLFIKLLRYSINCKVFFFSFFTFPQVTKSVASFCAVIIMNPLSLVVNAAIDMFVNVGKYQNMQHSWIQKLRMSVSLVAYEPLSQSFIPSPFVLSDCLICEIWVPSQHVSIQLAVLIKDFAHLH